MSKIINIHRRFLMRIFKYLLLIVVLAIASQAFAQTDAPAMTDDEMVTATDIFFDRCAGCHGVLRKGATGPNITPEHFANDNKGLPYIKAVIFGGLPGGMPDWGRQGILTDEEQDLMARFVLNDPPQPPTWEFGNIKDSWELLVPVADRPTEPQSKRNWENYVGVILRDVGKAAIIDGDTRELVTVVPTGYATHILRSSKSGRYFYVIGRDGKASMIDLFMDPPAVVAKVRPCLDARSIESSKFEGFVDKYAVVGCYWPSAFVVFDGLTLEPIKMVSTVSYVKGAGELVQEARVAAIVASEDSPEWILNVKESGQTWFVNYSNVDKKGHPLDVTMIDTERYLHDGGWANQRKYFIVAANAENKLVVIDPATREFVASVEAGVKPHPGRGANWVHSKLGPVWATGNIGSPEVTVVGVDPEGHPDQAWQAVERIEMPFTGTLFIKAHDASPWVITDFTVSSNPKGSTSLCAIGKESLKVEKCWEVPGAADIKARIVHIEFTKDGSEFWVSAWANKETPSFIAVYDSNTLEEIDRITGDWLLTPTGKFNVYNTANDIY